MKPPTGLAQLTPVMRQRCKSGTDVIRGMRIERSCDFGRFEVKDIIDAIQADELGIAVSRPIASG